MSCSGSQVKTRPGRSLKSKFRFWKSLQWKTSKFSSVEKEVGSQWRKLIQIRSVKNKVYLPKVCNILADTVRSIWQFLEREEEEDNAEEQVFVPYRVGLSLRLYKTWTGQEEIVSSIKLSVIPPNWTHSCQKAFWDPSRPKHYQSRLCNKSCQYISQMIISCFPFDWKSRTCKAWWPRDTIWSLWTGVDSLWQVLHSGYQRYKVQGQELWSCHLSWFEDIGGFSFQFRTSWRPMAEIVCNQALSQDTSMTILQCCEVERWQIGGGASERTLESGSEAVRNFTSSMSK